ncbi:aspartate/glutamate racemase family protein [Nonomuraea rhizosphaerae]|uniref:aspartate/glutamate racemase family protein n=1 Tax=Nonomuraea rhizosphaerae TaxID=2665663 RepID=UPI001C5EAE3F|nr:aspartate/glutamate racemase family protein [Nonomuraea rhizosphaerae]
MRVKVINPNTSLAMTDVIGRCAREVAARSTCVEAVSPAMGPASIESHYDEALAVPGVLAEIAAGERDDISGYVIACFGDPGLYAARELASGPVVGIAEAAMHTATLVGRTFSVVTSLSRTIGQAWDLARSYGFETACRGVHACDVPVLEMESSLPAVTALCSSALASDGSDSIVLGCAGMAPFRGELSRSLGVPVIDGITAAVKLVESLVALGLRTSTRDEFAPPIPKPYTGLLSHFQLP